MSTKPWKSKTLLANFLFAAAVYFGFDKKYNITADQLTSAILGLNIMLRLVTKNKIGLN